MNVNTRNLGFVNFNGQEMEWVKFNGVTVYEAWKKLIANGVPPLTLQKCKGVDLVDYKIYGESIQDGTPTPDTPIEIESVGDKTSNLFDKEYLSKTENYTINSGGGYFSAIIKVKPNTKYTVFSKRTEATDTPESGFYCKVALPTDRVGSISSFAYYIESSDRFATNNKKTVTTGDDGLIYFAVSGNGSQSMLDILFKYYYFQIVEGTTELEYEPYGYKIPVKVSGKNMAHPNGKNFTINGITTTVNKDGTITITGEAKNTQSTIMHWCGRKDDNNYWLDAIIYPGQTLIVNVINVETGLSINQMPVPFSLGRQFRGVITGKDYYGNAYQTANEPVYFCRLYSQHDLTAGENRYAGTWRILVTVDDNSTEYEPFVEPITTNIYLNEPLRKIGDYADYIDFENKKIVRNVKEIDITTLSWSYNSSNTVFATRISDGITHSDLKTNAGYCTHYPLRVGQFVTMPNKTFQNPSNYWSAYNYLVIRDNDYTDLTSFKNYLMTIKPKLTYILATPTEEEIELPNIPTHKGTTVIEVDTSILPSNMEVTYLGKK